jgi:tetratricopeptide (TPR) repeat protein
MLQEPYRRIRDKLVSIAPKKYRLFGIVAITITIVSASYYVYFSGNRFFDGYIERGVGLASMSEGGVNFFKDNHLEGPIFNDTDIGSYLIHHLYPQEKVFADNRFGDAYSPKFWDEAYLPILENEDSWKENLVEYDFNVIFLYQYDSHDYFRQFLFNRLNDNDWVFVYGDTFSIIFVRNVPKNKLIIDRFKMTPDNVYQRLKHLYSSDVEDDVIAAADIFNLVGRTDLARMTFLDVVTKRPGNGKIWMIMAEWELLNQNQNSSILSLMFLEKAIEVGYRTAEVYSFLGVSFYRLGRLDKAKEALEMALRINPNRSDANSLLKIVDIEMQ